MSSQKVRDKRYHLTTLRIALSFVVLIYVLPSCSPPLRFAQVSYDATTVNSIFDNKDADFIFFQFKRLETRGPKNSLSLTGYVYKYDKTLLSDSAYDATVVTPGKSEPFRNRSILGNLLVSKKDLLDSLLTDPATKKRIEFKNLLFTPQKEGIHIAYEITLEGAGEQYKTLSLVARPCPPSINCIKEPGQ